MTDQTRPPAFLTLVLLTALATLSLNLFLPSLPAIAREFDADYAVVSLAIAGYLAVTGVLQLVVGPLSDRYGRRPVMLAMLGLFVLASVGCVFSTDITVFLAFRMAQCGIIAGYTVALAVIRDVHTPQQSASLIGYLSMSMAVAPMLGPVLGGALEAAFGWRASFVFFTVAGAGLLALCLIDLHETNRTRAATLGAQMRRYPALLQSRAFWAYTACGALSRGTFYVFLAGAPLIASDRFGLPPSAIGIAIGSITGGFLTGSFISARLAPKTALSTLMIAGRLVAMAGLGIGLAVFATGGGGALFYFAATLCVGLGNGITIPGANAGSMSVDPDLAGSAAGLSGAATVGVGALLTPLAAWLAAGPAPASSALGLMLILSVLGLLTALAARPYDPAPA